MGKNGISWGAAILKGMLFGGITFGFLKLLTNNEVNQQIKEKLFEGMTTTTSSYFTGLIFTKTLDDLTPALLTFFPLLGYFQILTMALFVGILSFILKKSNLSFIRKAGLYIITLFGGYIVGTILLYISYFISSAALGLSFVESKNFLIGYQNGFDNVIIPILIGITLGIYIIFKLLRKKWVWQIPQPYYWKDYLK